MFQKNPLTMTGTIDRCWLFTFQSPPEWAEAWLPDALTPVLHNGHAFWNVVVCHVDRMRPKGFPKWTGVSYWHVAYRLYVNFAPPGEAPIEGLYFVRSDCSSPLMAVMGNIMTDFRFHSARIRVNTDKDNVAVNIDAPGGKGSAWLRRKEAPALPAYSAFDNLEEAAAFLKYKPYGISVDKRGSANVVSITRDEAAWHSRLVPVDNQEWAFFENLPIRPEICYEVDPIDYQWNRGKVYAPATKSVKTIMREEPSDLWDRRERLV